MKAMKGGVAASRTMLGASLAPVWPGDSAIKVLL
jgi:hypothetical protein